jgi:hypothetical protein
MTIDDTSAGELPNCKATVRVRNGDVLPMVGGPLDGRRRQVDFVLPFLNGGLAPAGWSCKINGVIHFYNLDTKTRCWQHQESDHA